jgi:hypothetical protein
LLKARAAVTGRGEPTGRLARLVESRGFLAAVTVLVAVMVALELTLWRHDGWVKGLRRLCYPVSMECLFLAWSLRAKRRRLASALLALSSGLLVAWVVLLAVGG